jgi:hypothetical protein
VPSSFSLRTGKVKTSMPLLYCAFKILFLRSLRSLRLNLGYSPFTIRHYSIVSVSIIESVAMIGISSYSVGTGAIVARLPPGFWPPPP